MSLQFTDLKAQYNFLKEDINAAIQKVLDHGQFIMGPEVEESEELLAKYTGSKHAITVSSGTDAAVIAMMAWGIKPGDEVIMPGFSFIATAETVCLLGANPVMVDVDPKTLNIDVNLIEKAITPKTKAIQPVSLYGQPANMDEINAIAKKHNLFVIEDAAQSFGAEYKGKKSCNLSDCGVTSFFPAKPLGVYGDGGAIFTNNSDMAEACKQIRFHGQTQRYYHEKIGMNGRMDTIQCAILIEKLKAFPKEMEARQKLATQYSEAFMPLTDKGVSLPYMESDRTSAWAQYTLRVPNRETLQQNLKDKGIPTSVHYPRTMANQPAYNNPAFNPFGIPESEKASMEVVSLPMHPYMSDQDRNTIVSAVLDCF